MMVSAEKYFRSYMSTQRMYGKTIRDINRRKLKLDRDLFDEAVPNKEKIVQELRSIIGKKKGSPHKRTLIGTVLKQLDHLTFFINQGIKHFSRYGVKDEVSRELEGLMTPAMDIWSDVNSYLKRLVYESEYLENGELKEYQNELSAERSSLVHLGGTCTSLLPRFLSLEKRMRSLLEKLNIIVIEGKDDAADLLRHYRCEINISVVGLLILGFFIYPYDPEVKPESISDGILEIIGLLTSIGSKFSSSGFLSNAYAMFKIPG